MTRVRIETATRPDEPNANGIIYSSHAWNKLMDRMKNVDPSDRQKIVVSINICDECRVTGSIPASMGFGFVHTITPTYIIVDIPSCIEDDPKIVNLVRLIHEGKVKAYMAYIGCTEHTPGDAYRYINEIDRILYFYLGYADPANIDIDIDAISIPRKKKKKSKKQKMDSKIKHYTKE